jgi:hypothetical protein
MLFKVEKSTGKNDEGEYNVTEVCTTRTRKRQVKGKKIDKRNPIPIKVQCEPRG